MVTKEVANITLKDLDRLKALAKYCTGVVVEGRVAGYSIAFTYSPGVGWYTVEIQDGNEIKRWEIDLGPCAERCGREAQVKYCGQERAVCMECYMAINAETRREKHGNDPRR